MPKESKAKSKDTKVVKPKINQTVRFIYIVMLVVFVPLAIYLLATFQLLAFFIMVGVTFILIKIIEWAFKKKDETK